MKCHRFLLNTDVTLQMSPSLSCPSQYAPLVFIRVIYKHIVIVHLFINEPPIGHNQSSS